MRDKALSFLLNKNHREKFPGEESSNNATDISLFEGMIQYEYASKIEGKAEKTLEQYEYVFNKFLDYLDEDPPLKEIQPRQIRGFLGHLRKKNLSKSTISINYRVLRAFFNWLVEENLLESSPLENINEPRTPNKFPRVLSSEQTETLIEVAKRKRSRWAGFRN